ncbi:glycosyltransferase, partial [Actinoplanes sp. NPDC051633]|uniref:glycosyltransferase n=1 Tax=Actinoplanes sp. NPDC051633 TaxID=3155670 RepID=UPI003425591A
MTVYFVLPGGVDDPARPSGGNRYDRAVCDRLRDVCEIAIPGTWPRPSRSSSDALAAALANIPEMSDVLIDGLVACGVPAVIEAARQRVVIIVHLPLGDESEAAADLVPLERRALHAAAAVVVTSAQAASRVVSLHDLPPEKVHVAPPGVDPAPPAEPSPGGGRLLCVAAISRRKGQDVLLEALARLDDLDWRCTFAGAGSLDEIADARRIEGVTRGRHHDEAAHGRLDAADAKNADAARRRLPHPGTGWDAMYRPGTTISGEHPQGRIRVLGPLAGDALDAAYADADVLVLPSRAETYGM